jgi:hypothetical protein
MKRVDTCAAEFEAGTPYMYSSYDGECECESDSNPKVLILGGGPNRIGQGIEFDYCCCHASFSLRDAGYETIMMNSNPETVSTDYDTSSRLYFEPLTVRCGTGWLAGWLGAGTDRAEGNWCRWFGWCFSDRCVRHLMRSRCCTAGVLYLAACVEAAAILLALPPANGWLTDFARVLPLAPCAG